MIPGRRLRLPIGWDDIRKFRGELYGLAILSVIVFHYFEGVDKSSGGTLALTARGWNMLIGSVGVDVFVFLSGFSIWHALSKGQRLSTFYARRVKRVVVPYLVVGVPFWAIKDLVLLGLPLSSFFADLSFLTFVTQGVRTVWYVPFIMGAYLLAPAIYHVFRRGVPCGVLVGAYVTACVVLFIMNPDYFMKVEIALLRIPVFVVGMWCGKLACEGSAVPAWLGLPLVLSVPLQVACAFTSNPFKRLVTGVYGILLMVLATWACKSAKARNGSYDQRWLRKLLVAAGVKSFELYVTHVTLRNLFVTVGVNVADVRWYALCIAVSIPLAMVLSLLAPSKANSRGAHFRRASG